MKSSSGSVVKPVRTLLSHSHNDVSDLKISNLVQPTSVRPVTVSAVSLHFRKLVVRFLEVPDCLPPPRSKCVTYGEQFFVKNRSPHFSTRRANGNGGTRNLFDDWRGRLRKVSRRLLSTSRSRRPSRANLTGK